MDQNVKFIYNEKKSCYVMIDYYRDRNPVGKIYNSALGCCHDFFSLTSLIKLIDEVILSETERNDMFQRRFVEELEDEPEWDQQTYPFNFDLKESRGHLATFKIDILFTQRKSWQGVIKWIENDSELCFRSVYELIQLIDNVVYGNQKIRMNCQSK